VSSGGQVVRGHGREQRAAAASQHPSLRPVRGTARDIERLVRDWLTQPDPWSVVIRTSGSTGEPKDVALSSGALRASAQATLTRLGGPGQWLLALPAHYVAGLQVIVRSALSDSSPVVLDEHLDLAAAVASLPAGRRYLAAVPTQLHRWLDDDRSTTALLDLDAVLVGGSVATPDLMKAARSAGIATVTTYGMSETCGGCVYDGVPLDGVAVALDRQGRIRINGPVLFDGYAGRPDLTQQVVSDGWLTTPDLGRFDDDGHLVVVGRADDVVVSGGLNVPLGAVERIVAGLAGVHQACVVGRPDAEWGTVVVAVVAPASAAAAPSIDAIRAAVSATHPRVWAPREVVVVDAIPMLESGKVDRQRVLAMVATT
jgi:O-succinylbenzoic acid--CoA ligase